ncbi:L-fucose/L-arabinose isomerase family protein [Pleomorphomonas carboxyditropha]|uniref:L-fucose isomerase n=1 Tax=Pleomorphomonas carboxyditropha TaxID=2023338 RepID=A0A2G9WTS0_9HYPH|nr:L-fucose/L-arabinose isomerase family protein [Pleomorphomonas carboxyditropha]PIO98111.1 L-fucose isomerase [Pleomorphomonas carboxyditropha]
MVSRPKIGIIGFSDGEPAVHEQLKAIVQKQVDSIVAEVNALDVMDLVTASTLVNSPATAKTTALEMIAQGVDGVIFSYGVFSFPNFSAIAAQFLKMPCLLMANLNPDWPGMVSMLASGGALNQLGIQHFRAAGDIHDPEVRDKVVSFARSAHVVGKLRGSTYGLVGGRSLGMYSATVSMQDWQQKFGIDVEHVDQSEIVRLAEEVPADKVEKAFAWLTENVKEIRYDGVQLTPDKLKRQIRHYEATKRLAAEKSLDFVGVKCHYELSRHHCTQCISAAFMNDPYDWDGPKEPMAFACEADSDAGLTMQILKLLTDSPVLFMDVRHWDAERGVMVFCNCGSESTYYATGSDDYKANLGKTTLYPALGIYSGGGCHVNLMTHAGKATIARLCRKNGAYRMTMFDAEFVELPDEVMKETTEEWPHVFAKLPFDYRKFIDKFDANHCHAVYGSHIEDISKVCAMLGIELDILSA